MKKKIKIKLTTQPSATTRIFLFFFGPKKIICSWPNAATWSRAATQSQYTLQHPFQDFNMANAAWKKLKDNKSDCERVKKRNVGDTMHKLLVGNELTVQRLSSAISGKAQNDARIGPREFVPFTEDERTIESFKVPMKFCFFCDAHLSCQISRTLLQYFQRYRLFSIFHFLVANRKTSSLI